MDIRRCKYDKKHEKINNWGMLQMKCRNCGAEIPDGYLYCERCGTDVQMVPDYNPLDDVLTAQVRGALGEEQPQPGRVQPMEERTRRGAAREAFVPENIKNVNGMISYTMRLPIRTADTDDGEAEEETAEEYPVQPVRDDRRREAAGRKKKREDRRKPSEESRQRMGLKERKRQREEEQRKKEAEDRRRRKLARRRARIISVVVLVLCAGGLSIFLYLNSYSGLVFTGNRYLSDGRAGDAEAKFLRAVSRDGSQADAYKGLEKIYLSQKDLDKAEKMYLDAVGKYPSNVEIYRACIEFYQNTDQLPKISALLEGCDDDGVLDDLNMYVSAEPKFSLEEEHYDDVQQLSIKSSGEAIYYTLDGTEATTSGTPYTEPIQIAEGTTTVRAISVNKEGVPSTEVTRTYTIEFPIVDAPAVSPSTGHYDQPKQITVQVPEGYTAYYTISNAAGEIELPTSASTKYTGPVDMPEGNNIFCAVLIDSKGRSSEVKKMNYELSL